MGLLYWKHRILRTPLEGPVRALRALGQGIGALRHPELAPLYREERCLDAVIARCVQPDSNCIDVGAHIGSVLSILVRLAPRGRHVAFEPLPEKARWLARKFPEVDVRAIALADRPGVEEFVEDLSESGYSSLRSGGELGPSTRLHRIQTETLDRVLAPDYRPAFLKIDVEGAELAVLQGARETLRRASPRLLFERGPAADTSAEELFAFLTETLGYAIFKPGDYLAGAAPLSRAAFLRTQIYPFQAFNFVAEPTSDAPTTPG